MRSEHQQLFAQSGLVELVDAEFEPEVLNREPPEEPEDDDNLLLDSLDFQKIKSLDNSLKADHEVARLAAADASAAPRKDTICTQYGHPESPSRLAALLPPGPGGLIWHAEIVGDDWFSEADCFEDGSIKPRRAILPVRASDFFDSLVLTDDFRWIFSGSLNGWPALNCLELRSITIKKKGMMSASIVRLWDAENNPEGTQPAFPSDGCKAVRATLRMAPWTARGWYPECPGCVWWFFAECRQGPSFAYGRDMLSAIEAEAAGAIPQAVRIHLFAHRYSRGGKPETTKEGMTWHSLLLLEWDHGRHATVVELATLNGVGGRRGKSNWYHDKLEHNTALYKAMPPEMILPWKGHYAEVRCADVPARNADEFMAYLKEYEGPKQRFVEPTHQHEGDVRLCYRSKVDIARYLLNYMGRDRRYTEESRNCQSFAADFFSFAAGKKDIKPFHKANRILYKNRSHLFLYDPAMYDMPVVTGDESQALF